jgi:FSR family fosmidomycin resistance protein-like MFS transporter
MSSDHKTRTLWLTGVLHAFTHIYQVALLPLYLPMQKDFKLENVGQATLFMTAMMAGYFLPSYPMGVLADRFSRKKLLAIGLVVNGLGFVGLSFAANYTMALAWVVLAGFGGSFFHPAATAMVARLFPVGTGKALGLLGIGASIGFFLGPIYAGWRAETAGWRAPIMELGLAGMVGALLFAWLAEDTAPLPGERVLAVGRPARLFPTVTLWLFFIPACLAFSLRDFAGSSMGSLGSLFLQHAHGMGLGSTGLALSWIFLPSAISNPIFGGLSDGGRLRWASSVLVVAAVVVAAFPHLPRPWLIPAFLVYGFFFMSSYPIIEAALMESVPDAVRGRVFGFFITIGGLVGNLSHWLVGHWVQSLGAAASVSSSFYALYGTLALLILSSLAGLPCLRAIRRREQQQRVASTTPPSAISHQQSALP